VNIGSLVNPTSDPLESIHIQLPLNRRYPVICEARKDINKATRGFKRSRYSLTAEVLRHNLALKPAIVDDPKRDAVLAPLNDLVGFTLQYLVDLRGKALGNGHAELLCFWKSKRQRS
jgi:hypothetical protein